MTIPDAIDLFLYAAREKPGQPAISLGGEHVTYASFEDRVRRYAGEFARASGPRLLIALPQGLDAYAAMLGAGLGGCYYAPLNSSAPAEKHLSIARILQPDVVVAHPDMAALLAQSAPEARVVDPAKLAAQPLGGAGRRHEIAYIIFTPGTTGIPKGVVIPRTALNHYIDWVRYSETVRSTDRIAQYSNIAFDVSITDIYGALCLGAVLIPAIGRADRMFPARLIARERLTVWNSTPSVVSLMMQAGETSPALLGSLRLLNACGEPLLPSHLSALFSAVPDLIVQNSYGPTETTVTMTELRLGLDNFRDACGTSVAIGSPIRNMSIHLLGSTHPDEGEIVIAGPQLASEYWLDPEKTASCFRTIQVDGKAARAYFSGDWAERRNGHIFFKERIDQQVKIRGFRLELDEVSRVIHEQGFAVTCVLKWRDELTAVIELDRRLAPDEHALRKSLTTRLEPHAVPTIIRWIDRIPRTANDKLDRAAVKTWLDRSVEP